MNDVSHYAELAPATGRYTAEYEGQRIADTIQAVHLLETYHGKTMKPVLYVPPQDVNIKSLREMSNKTFCPIKGEANYYSLQTPEYSLDQVAWSYLTPMAPLEPITGYLAFYLDKITLTHHD